MQPILFLDIDGVLNGHQYDGVARSCLIDPACVQRLNRVIAATDCRVVLSSAWRYMILGGGMTLAGFSYLLRTHGIHVDDRLIGYTDDDGEPITPRGQLIQRWLDTNGRPSRWAVVDDLGPDMERVESRLVRPDGTVGMSDADADRLIDLLIA